MGKEGQQRKQEILEVGICRLLSSLCDAIQALQKAFLASFWT